MLYPVSGKLAEFSGEKYDFGDLIFLKDKNTSLHRTKNVGTKNQLCNS